MLRMDLKLKGGIKLQSGVIRVKQMLRVTLKVLRVKKMQPPGCPWGALERPGVS